MVRPGEDLRSTICNSLARPVRIWGHVLASLDESVVIELLEDVDGELNSGLALICGGNGGLVVRLLRITKLSGLVESLEILRNCLLEILDLLIQLILLSSELADGAMASSI